jgi:hypothetical protein
VYFNLIPFSFIFTSAEDCSLLDVGDVVPLRPEPLELGMQVGGDIVAMFGRDLSASGIEFLQDWVSLHRLNLPENQPECKSAAGAAGNDCEF